MIAQENDKSSPYTVFISIFNYTVKKPSTRRIRLFRDNKTINQWIIHMQNVVLTILLILAVALIGIILMQRSEGGGLGIGGGGANTAGRSVANAMTKLTWFFGASFMACCIMLTILSSKSNGNSSVLDGITIPSAESISTDSNLLPPKTSDNVEEPIAPPATE